MNSKIKNELINLGMIATQNTYVSAQKSVGIYK